MYDSYQTKRKRKSKSRRKEKDAEKTTTPDVSYDPLVQNKDDEDDPVDSGAEYESDDDVPDVADLAPQEPDDPNAQVWFSRDVFGMLDDGKKKNKQTTKDNFDDDSDDMEVDVKEEPKLQKGKQQKKTGDDKKKVKSKQEDESSDDDQTGRKKKKKSKKRKKTDEDEDTGFEEVPIQRVEAVDEPWDQDENETITDTVTSWDAADTDEEAEDLALGKKLVQKKLKLSELVDMTFNRYTWNDDGAPKWFTEEDSTHRRPLKPITKEEVDAMRERFREINSRPIKKVAEAKARKKLRAMKQLEKAKKAAESIANNQDLSNKDKMKQIEKLYAKGLRKQKQETVYVVSKKGGLSKSTKIKGKRVKIVDPRQKKDKRSEKAQAKRAKK